VPLQLLPSSVWCCAVRTVPALLAYEALEQSETRLEQAAPISVCAYLKNHAALVMGSLHWNLLWIEECDERCKKRSGWEISVSIFKNTVILKQLGLAIGIPFGLSPLLLYLFQREAEIRCMHSGSSPRCLY